MRLVSFRNSKIPCRGEKVDAINFTEEEITKLDEKGREAVKVFTSYPSILHTFLACYGSQFVSYHLPSSLLITSGIETNALRICYIHYSSDCINLLPNAAFYKSYSCEN